MEGITIKNWVLFSNAKTLAKSYLPQLRIIEDKMFAFTFHEQNEQLLIKLNYKAKSAAYFVKSLDFIVRVSNYEGDSQVLKDYLQRAINFWTKSAQKVGRIHLSLIILKQVICII